MTIDEILRAMPKELYDYLLDEKNKTNSDRYLCLFAGFCFELKQILLLNNIANPTIFGKAARTLLTLTPIQSLKDLPSVAKTPFTKIYQNFEKKMSIIIIDLFAHSYNSQVFPHNFTFMTLMPHADDLSYMKTIGTIVEKIRVLFSEYQKELYSKFELQISYFDDYENIDEAIAKNESNFVIDFIGPCRVLYELAFDSYADLENAQAVFEKYPEKFTELAKELTWLQEQEQLFLRHTKNLDFLKTCAKLDNLKSVTKKVPYMDLFPDKVTKGTIEEAIKWLEGKTAFLQELFLKYG